MEGSRGVGGHLLLARRGEGVERRVEGRGDTTRRLAQPTRTRHSRGDGLREKTSQVSDLYPSTSLPSPLPHPSPRLLSLLSSLPFVPSQTSATSRLLPLTNSLATSAFETLLFWQLSYVYLTATQLSFSFSRGSAKVGKGGTEGPPLAGCSLASLSALCEANLKCTWRSNHANMAGCDHTDEAVFLQIKHFIINQCSSSSRNLTTDSQSD